MASCARHNGNITEIISAVVIITEVTRAAVQFVGTIVTVFDAIAHFGSSNGLSVAAIVLVVTGVGALTRHHRYVIDGHNGRTIAVTDLIIENYLSRV